MQQPTPSTTERLLTQSDVAERLGASVNWVRQQTKAGHLSHVVLGDSGRIVRYTPAAVEAFIAQREVPAATAPNPHGRRRRGAAA